MMVLVFSWRLCRRVLVRTVCMVLKFSGLLALYERVYERQCATAAAREQQRHRTYATAAARRRRKSSAHAVIVQSSFKQLVPKQYHGISGGPADGSSSFTPLHQEHQSYRTHLVEQDPAQYNRSNSFWSDYFRTPEYIRKTLENNYTITNNNRLSWASCLTSMANSFDNRCVRPLLDKKRQQHLHLA